MGMNRIYIGVGIPKPSGLRALLTPEAERVELSVS